MRYASDCRSFRVKHGAAIAALCSTLVLAPGCRRPAAPAGAPTAQLHGRVLTADGQIPSGGRAVLERETADRPVELAAINIDRHGDFVLAGLAPGRYLLRTEAPGFATVSVPVELQPGDRLTTSLRFEREQRLEGVIEDSAGAPLPEALVLLWPASQRKARVLEATSGADGRFAVGGLPRGTWILLAEAPGFGTRQLDHVEVPGPPLVLKLDGESHTLGGLVLQGDRQIAGATVYLGGAALRAPRRTVTDRHGTFVFRGVGLGKYTMRAAHERQASTASHQIIDEGTGWLPPFRLALEPGAFVDGKVVDDTGRALAGVPIDLLALPSDDIPLTVETDGGGGFSFGPVQPGRYRILARAPGHVQMDSSEAHLRIETTPAITVRATRAARLSGRVVDGAGKPVQAASVTVSALVASGARADELTVLTGTLPLAAEAAGLPGATFAPQGKVRTAVTDMQGRFVVDEMPPGRLRLEVTPLAHLPVRREPVDLSPGERRDVGDLVVESGAVISGRVLDEAGQPIEGARLEVRPTGPDRGSVVRLASDRDGRFAVRVPGGDYSLLALAPARAPRSIFALHATPGSAPPPFELRLPRAVGSLEGQVRDDHGRPVARANVMVLAAPTALNAAVGTPWRPRSSVEMENTGAALTLTSVATDWQGKFKLRGLPAEPLIIEVRHPDWPPVALVGRAGETASVQLARPGGVEGEIREKGTGAFVARYELDMVGPEGRRPERIERQGAGFSALGLQPGRWKIKVASPGFDTAEQDVEIPPGESRHEPSLAGVLVELSRGAAQ
jgi:protocatechuate 3,4-dioxygenase beta subunit